MQGPVTEEERRMFATAMNYSLLVTLIWFALAGVAGWLAWTLWPK